MTDHVLVTGGSQGIGAAIVQRALGSGYACTVLDRVAPAAGEAAEFFAVDLTDTRAIAAAVARAARDHAITRLVNNVGVAYPAGVEDAQSDDLRQMMEINVVAAVEIARLLIPGMKAAGFGRIVNISSRSALGRANMSLYAATKAAVNALTRSWALELAPHGITVNAVGPGVIGTDLLARTFPEGSERRLALERSIPAGRIGEPEDIAGAVSYFLGADARYVTGQILYVCGGTSIIAAT
jgi:3-oxoacyl-[acyl-carrier protein] reductase